MHPVTFAPSSRHAAGFWSFFLHARYAALRSAHRCCRCLCTEKSTAEVAAPSAPDMVTRVFNLLSD